MVQDATSDDNCDWNSDDDLEIDNYQSSPRSSPLQSQSQTKTFVGVPVTNGSLSSPSQTTDLVEMGFSDEMFARLVDMGFPVEMISRAIKEAGPNAETSVIIDTISKYSSELETGSSKSKAIDHFLAMGFDEEKIIKALHVHGEENMEEVANSLLTCAEVKKLPVVEEKDDSDWSLSDDEIYCCDMLISDDEDPNFSNKNSQIRSLVEMGFSELEASVAVERCGKKVGIAVLIDFIYAARMDPGLPNKQGLITPRVLEVRSQGPPFFYYGNVASSHKDLCEAISSHLYHIPPEFVNSKYFCAVEGERGYIHNLPLTNRFQIEPLPKLTIIEAFPLSKKWWPEWDTRTKLNCISIFLGSAQKTNSIHAALEPYNRAPELPEHVKKSVIRDCKRWNLIWVGKNKVAPLEPDEMENLMGFPKNHTRGGGMSITERYKSLGKSFQVDTVAYQFSVLKPIFPDGIKVLSLFTGIGGGEVALHRLGIKMKLVVSVEMSEVKRNVLKCFWEQTKQTGVLIQLSNVNRLTNEKIEELMEEYGGFDLVIGRSPSDRVGDLLFSEYVRILMVVRRMRRS